MNITLKPDIEKRINEKIRSVEFASADAIVEQALTFFLDYEEGEMGEAEFRDTKAAIGEALDQGERGEGVTLEEFDHGFRAQGFGHE